MIRPRLSFDRFFRYRLLRKFIAKNINLSIPLYSSDDFNQFLDSSGLDHIVIGSDQVWRDGYCPQLEDYTASKRPASINATGYAVSFGSGKFTGDLEYYSKCVTMISRLSFRERQASDWHNASYSPKSSCVLDPALLILESEYVDYLNLVMSTNESHGYTYILDGAAWKSRVIERVSSSLSVGFSGFDTTQTMKAFFLSPPSFHEWIASFYHSSFVITDSFHGMVLSIRFRKPFLVLANDQRGVERFTSLLSFLGLEDRLIRTESEYDQFDSMKKIDWEEISTKLDGLRHTSLRFLTESIYG